MNAYIYVHAAPLQHSQIFKELLTGNTGENKGVEALCFRLLCSLSELVEPGGIEPPTPCLQSRCSPS